jgi:hypothetical protein
VTLARSKPIQIPDRVCLRCFNSQQRFAFPFLVYCPHSECLALISSPLESAIFDCKPAQLPAVLNKLSSTQGVPTDAIPPTGERL